MKFWQAALAIIGLAVLSLFVSGTVVVTPDNGKKPDVCVVKPPTVERPISIFIAEETGDGRLNHSQAIFLASKEFDDWKQKYCEKDKNGVPEYRRFDPDVDPGLISGDDPNKWVDVLARPRAKGTWIVVSNGVDGGTEGLLPARGDDIMAFLERCRKGQWDGERIPNKN